MVEGGKGEGGREAGEERERPAEEVEGHCSASQAGGKVCSRVLAAGNGCEGKRYWLANREPEY